MKKILFVIADYPDGRQDFFEKWMSPRNKEYAEKHGFEYREIRKLPKEQNGKFFRDNPTWLKFKIVDDWISSGEISDGDIVSHIDADICVADISEPFQTNKSFGYAIDSCNTHCMGAYTITVNKWSRDLLKNILDEDLYRFLEVKSKEPPGNNLREQAAWYFLAGITQHSWIPFNELGNFGFRTDVSSWTKYSLEELSENVEVLPTEWNVTHVAGEGFNDYFMIPTHRNETVFRHFAGGGLWDESYFAGLQSLVTLEPSHLRCSTQFSLRK